MFQFNRPHPSGHFRPVSRLQRINRPRAVNRTDPRRAQRSDCVAPRRDPAAQSGSGAWIAARARASIGLVALLVACVGAPLSALAEDCPRAEIRVLGPGAVFDSVEAAALAALSHAHLDATLTDRRSLRVGVIHRVANGYSYTAAKRSAASSPRMTRSVRYRLRAIDVARYLIPPRSEKVRINRYNEEPTPKEKQIVDELDPAHRPLYQLTPSLNVVRYRQGGRTTVVANLKDLGAPKALTTASGVRGARVTSGALCAARSTTLFARSAPFTAPD